MIFQKISKILLKNVKKMKKTKNFFRDRPARWALAGRTVADPAPPKEVWAVLETRPRDSTAASCRRKAWKKYVNSTLFGQEVMMWDAR